MVESRLVSNVKNSGSTSLLLVGKLLLGLGLIAVIVVLATGLREHEAAPSFSRAATPPTQPPRPAGVPSPLEQAKAAKGSCRRESWFPRITVFRAASAKAKTLKEFPGA